MSGSNPTFRAEFVVDDKSSKTIDRITARALVLGKAAEAATNPWHKAITGDSAIARAMNMSRETGGFFGGRSGGGISGIGAAMAGAQRNAAANLWAGTGASIGAATQQMGLFARASAAAHTAGARVAGLAAPFARLKHPLMEMREGAVKAGESFKGLGEKFVEILPVFAAFGAAASVAGLFELTHRIAESFSELSRSAVKIGISTAAMQQLSYAAQMTDTPLQSMQTGLFRLNRGVADAAAGKNKDLAGLLRHLGIATRDASGHLVGASDTLPRLQAAFRNTTDPAMRARMAMALFGRGGAEMLPFLMASQEEMKAWSEQAKRLVYPFSKTDTHNLEVFKQSWIGMNTAVGGFMDAVSARLAPVLSPVVNMVADWTAANRDWIATGIADEVKQFGGWVRVAWPQVKQAGVEMWALVRPVAEFVRQFGTVKIAIEAAAVVMVGRWVEAAGIMVGRFAAMVVWANRAAWTIGTKLVAAINILEVRMNAFNLSAARSPIMRTLMIMAAMYDKFNVHGATPDELDQLPPGEAAKGGWLKGPDGKWRNRAGGEAVPLDEQNRNWWSHPAGSAPEDFMKWLRGLSYPTRDAEPGPSPLSTTSPGGTANALQLLRDALRPDAGQRSAVDINVQFTGTPPGTAVTTRTAGPVAEPHVDVGFAFPNGEVWSPH